MEPVAVFVSLCALLVMGKALRLKIPLFQRLYLPSSVVGGLLGLLVVTLAGPHLPPALQGCVAGARRVPGFLINIIFATLFLGMPTPKFRDIVKLAFPQLCLGQMLAWGQYAVGLGLAGFLLAPKFGVPPAFGNLLEIGFEGGHGTVAGMSASFTEHNWEDGAALGFTMATIGMLAGIVIGMTLIQWAYRKGYVTKVVSFEERGINERLGIHPKEARPVAGRQTVISDSIDSLAWHIAIIGVAVLIGYALLKLISIKSFPLFPLCMIGGVLLELAARLLKIDLLVDRQQMERISGAALDFLVVSAVATIQLKVVAANWQALALLAAFGTLWSIGVVVFVAPRVFRDAWFERAIAEYGQATGVTATGLMLLRTVDPDNKTSAAVSFGYKQLLHEPFMGGGLWTATAFSLVYDIGWKNVWLISCAMLLAWSAVAAVIARRNAARQ